MLPILTYADFVFFNGFTFKVGCEWERFFFCKIEDYWKYR